MSQGSIITLRCERRDSRDISSPTGLICKDKHALCVQDKTKSRIKRRILLAIKYLLSLCVCDVAILQCTPRQLSLSPRSHLGFFQEEEKTKRKKERTILKELQHSHSTQCDSVKQLSKMYWKWSLRREALCFFSSFKKCLLSKKQQSIQVWHFRSPGLSSSVFMATVFPAIQTENEERAAGNAPEKHWKPSSSPKCKKISSHGDINWFAGTLNGWPSKNCTSLTG